MNLIQELVELGNDIPDVVEFEDDTKQRRLIQRGFLGNPATVFIHAKKGEHFTGAGEAFGNQLRTQLQGAGVGATGGAAAGLGAAGVAALLKKRIPVRAALGVGAGVGAYGGLLQGSIKGAYGKTADEIYRRRTGQ